MASSWAGPALGLGRGAAGPEEEDVAMVLGDDAGAVGVLGSVSGEPQPSERESPHMPMNAV